MSNSKKRSYTNVTQKDHDYINSLVDGKAVSNQGEAISEIVNNNLLFNELGLDAAKVEKLRMVTSMLSENDNNVTLSSLMNRMIELSLSEANAMNEIDEKEVIENKSISVRGSARVRIEHFVEMIKEHNSKSPNTLMITQTLLSKGLSSNKSNYNIDLSKIKASDKSFFENGTNSNRNAIKRVVMDNNGFKAYNSTLGNESIRKHNQNSIKNLSK